MKKRRFSGQLFAALTLAAGTLMTTSCADRIYFYPQYNYTGRATPPSGLQERVLASYTANGSTGGLEILDGLRDLRSNVQNTKPFFTISGYSSGNPIQIFNFPEEQRGYVFSNTDGSLANIDYAKETSSGTAANFGGGAPTAAAAPDGSVFAGATAGGQMAVTTGGTTYALNIPNLNKVVINRGANIILAMARNSNALYRIVKVNASATPTPPPGAVDCQPLLLPVFCVMPVGNTNSAGTTGAAYDHPVDAYFSLDGNTVDILNCGPECGGTTASVTVLSAAGLDINNIPTVDPSTRPAPLATIPVANPVPIPGGVTVAVSDGTTLYLAGQNLQSGRLGGNMTMLPLNTYVPSAPVSIADGTHTRMLFADNNTLWIAASSCANGVRAAKAQSELATQGFTDQAGNYNCLTMVTLGTTVSAKIIPQVVQSNVSSTKAVAVAYPNTDQNQYYYGSATGECWVQSYNKVYTAYGGQIHIFNTTDGSERDNTNATVQGTVLDVAYMDANTNDAD